MVFLIIIIVWLISWIFVLFTLLFSERKSRDPIQCYTGSLGQGKSKIGVSQSVKFLKKNRLLWAIGVIKASNKVYYKKIDDADDGHYEDIEDYNLIDWNQYRVENSIPLLYSNIPIRFKNSLLVRLLAKFRGVTLQKYESHVQLEYEHLVMLKGINEYSILFIDEIGEFANQYSYANPFVVQYLQRFIRFWRHGLDGVIVITDQATDNITKPIRVRIGKVYNLIDFRRFLFHWYKVNVLDVMMTEDIQTINSSQMEDPPYFFGHLPYKYFKFLDWTRLFTYKKYESRAYKALYKFVYVPEEDMDYNGGLFTNYVIEMPDNEEMKKQFRKDGFISYVDMIKYVKIWRDNVVNA